MSILQSLCLILWLNAAFGRQGLPDEDNLKTSILEASTTSGGKVSSVLRDILNQESLVRFSMVQRIQNLVLEVIDNKNNSQIVKQKLKILTKALKDLETRDNRMEIDVTKLKEALKTMNETVRNNQDLTVSKFRDLKKEELVVMSNQTSVLQEESRELLAENKRIKQQLVMLNKTNTLLNVSYNALQEEIQQIKNREFDVRNKNQNLSTETDYFREQLNDFKNTLKDIKASLYERRLQRLEDSFKNFSLSFNETLDGLLQDHKVINLQLSNASSLSTVKSPVYAKYCYNILEQNKSLKGKDGVYEISIDSNITSVFCDMSTDGGGWTVLQKRIDGSTGFYRTWEEYKHGFGDPKNNYWIGNDAIHALTKDQNQELRVDLQRFNGETAYAEYSTFYIGNEADKYRLTISGYTGTAGDSLDYYNYGIRFSTKDEDNDHDDHVNCARIYHGAWWFYHCTLSNLNGEYGQSAVTGHKYPSWFRWKNKYEALQKTKMMIRHKN